jgi:tetratricopeptide (TPR) repeat protein
MHGTIGKRFYHFERLDEEEASELLLKAAGQKDPWTPPIMHLASTITKKLGALPLALIHAGQAIKAKYCGLNDYLAYYDQSWDMIRQNQRMTGYRGGEDANMEEYLKVYASYEIVYRGFEAMEYQRFKDAVQILKLFSFLHHENIPFDILVAAVRHPRIEREAQKRDEELRKTEEIDKAKRKPFNVVQQPKSWPKYFRELAFGVLEPLFMDRSPTVLPTFLRDADLSTTPDDCKVRLRKALYELTQLSLITHHETTDSYSMHPLVHTWVRERPQMRTQDQAIWCEAAITTLSRCILLPPLSNSVESHTDLPRQLLPHFVAVEKRQEKIRAEFANNQKKRKRLWPVLKSGIYPQKALQLAKSSLVYSHCGYFVEAEIRQRIVMEYVCRMRGSDHPRAMDITLALSGTLWQQSRTNEAAQLQNQVLQVCLKSLGPDHPRTLKVMDILGESRRQQGRFTESLELHGKAIHGMKLRLPETDPAVFHALDHLGLTLWYCFRFEDAKQHQEMAVAGLKRLLGEADLKTLSAIESLAMTYMELGTEYLKTDRELGGQYLDTAYKDMLFVIEERTKQLGDKQPYTWLAKCNLGRIKSAMGDLDEAENLITSLLPMAVGHLGEDHMGVLAGKNHLAKILVKQKRYTEAEEVLSDISRPEKYAKTTTATGEHPDRCEALWNLLECYQKQGKIDDGLRTCDELSAAVVTIRRGGKQTESSSIFWQMIQDKRTELQAARRASTTELGSTTVELRPKLGVAVSSDTQVVTTVGDLRQRRFG